MNVRTDLAMEVLEGAAGRLPGVRTLSRGMDYGVVRQDVDVVDETGANAIGKPVGSYITVEAREVLSRDLDVQRYTAEVLAEALKELVDGAVPEKNGRITTLVVGLGNRGMTADALGPKTCDKVIVTRHIYELIQKELDKRLQSVCAIAPGVLGVTGIETFDVIKGVVDKVRPDVVLTVDSLASRKTGRISTTFQMTDTGIVPGGGLQNARMELSKKSLNVPVIAVGVPMVVYASTIARDVIEELYNDRSAYFAPDTAKVNAAVNNTVSEVLGDLVVTPKDVDKIVSDAAFVLGTAINLALHRELTTDDVVSYMH